MSWRVAVLHLQQLALGVYLYAHVAFCHFVVPDITPVGQLLGNRRTLVVLDAHGVACHIPYGQSALSEGRGLGPQQVESRELRAKD